MVLLNIVYNTLRPLRRLTNFQTSNIKLDATRTYARWMSRQPVAILNEDELYEAEDTTKENVSPRRSSSRKSTKEKPSVKTEGKGKSKITVLEQNDKIFRSLMTKAKSRKLKEKNDEIVLEGYRLIKDGITAGAEPTALFFNNQADIDALTLPEGIQLYKVPYKSIQLWSCLSTAPGLIGVFKTPDVSAREAANDSLPLTIICDNVRDPGNLGSIMRAAAAVGCEKLILMKGCIDLWNQKVLRSAAGTHFQLPIHTSLKWDQIPSLINENSNIFVTDSNFGDEFISNYESDVLKSSMGIFNIKPGSLKETFDSTKWKPSVPTNKKTMKQFLLGLPIVPYYALDYTEQEIVLVLSGETEGLSLESYEFLNERKGIRINIPLLNGVNSLNTGVALGIVTFEMRRQIIKRQNEL